MASMGCDEHDAELAVSAKGEETSAPGAGLLTVTLANAGTAQTISARKREEQLFMRTSPPFF
jgi:hypothetical protein